MTSKQPRWSVWSKDPSRDGWMVVDPDCSEEEAREGAARRTRTAAKHGMEALFTALPVGQTPHGPSDETTDPTFDRAISNIAQQQSREIASGQAPGEGITRADAAAELAGLEVMEADRLKTVTLPTWSRERGWVWPPAAPSIVPSPGAAPSSEPDVYPFRTGLAPVCDACCTPVSFRVVDSWIVPEPCRHGCPGAGWRILAVQGAAGPTSISAAWEDAAEATFATGANPYRNEEAERS